MSDNYYRVIAFAANGSVIDTETCDEGKTDEAHDRLMEHPLARTTFLAGPFPKGKTRKWS